MPPDGPVDSTPSTSVELSCGHRVRLPWGLSPEVALAELLRHETDCDAELERPFVGGFRRSIESVHHAAQVRP